MISIVENNTDAYVAYVPMFGKNRRKYLFDLPLLILIYMLVAFQISKDDDPKF